MKRLANGCVCRGALGSVVRYVHVGYARAGKALHLQELAAGNRGMGTCLTDQQVTAFVGGSASAGEMSTWNEHLDECEGCAARVADKHAEITTHRQPGTVPAAGMRLGPYEIVAELGAGGMGQVFRAKDTRLDREVAIKVLAERLANDPDARARFEREGKAVAALSHPNILAIHDVGIDRGISYAVTELLTGETLRQRLRAEALPWRRATEYGIAMANGLAAAHDKGIIHRDLKPDNVFVTSDGVVKILDFGLARTVPATPQPDDADNVTVTLETKPGMILGTVNYMSPEQVRGRPTDARSDIFSFGCVLYELVTGRRPFEADSAAETMTAILKHHPPEPRTVATDSPPELDRVITRCLEKKPDERFQSARDLAFTLRTVLSDSDVSRPTGDRSTSARGARWWAVGAAAAVVFVAAAAIYFARPDRTGSATAIRPIRPLTNFVGLEDSPTWSPDASMIAFEYAKFGHSDIFVMSVAGGEPLRRTDDPADDLAPHWSPKGSLLAFLSDRGAGTDVYLIPPLSGRERRLAGTQISYVDQVGAASRALGAMPWSPDEEELLFSRLQPTGQLAIWKVAVKTGRLTQSTDPPPGTHDLAASWSWNGEWIVFERRRKGRGSLWLRSADGSDERPLLEDEHDNGQPAWSPDGKEIVFSTDRTGPWSLWALDVATGRKRPLTAGSRDALVPAVAHDGRIAFTEFSHQTDLYVLSIDGEQAHEQLTNFTHDNFAARFRPTDGKMVVYHSTRTGDNEIWLHDRATGEETRLTTNPANDLFPDWSPDGRRVLFASDRGDGEFRLWIMDVAGRDPQRVTDQIIVAAPPAASNFISASLAPRWAPDGEAIGYIAASEKGLAFWTIGVDGKDARAHLTGVLGFDWYRDSHRVLYTRRALKGPGTMEMVAHHLDGNLEDEILLEAPHVELIAAPDGSAVAYCDAVSHMNMDLFLLPLQSAAPNALPTPAGEPRRLTHGNGKYHIHNGGWHPDAKQIVYTRDEDAADIWVIAKP